MRKNVAGLLCLVTVLLAFGSIANAQQPAKEPTVNAQQLNEDAIQLMRQDIRSQRKQLIAANLPLTDTEAMKFWPVYDRYVAEQTKVYDTRYALIKEYAQGYDNMTDQQANSFINRWITADQSLGQLRLKWVPEFEKVISPKKTAMLMQIDRRVGLMLELQLASGVPLVKP